MPIATAADAVLDDRDLRHMRDFVSVLSGFERCSSAEATASLRHLLATRFNSEQRRMWRNPRKGVWRSLEANAPCDDTQRWWVSPHDTNVTWQAHPMYRHCCNKGVGIVRCPGGRILHDAVHSAHCGRSKAVAGLCESDVPLLCESFLRLRDPRRSSVSHRARPVVYSFGIAKEWAFEDWAGGGGFDVFAFDPTDASHSAHTKHHAKGVTFHYMGLGARGGRAGALRTGGYGGLGGEVLALDDLARRIGHDISARPIRLLKIDCEGCEWEAFVDVAERAPHVLEHVCTLVLEIHVTRSLQMNSTADLKRFATFWRLYVVEAGFRFWFLHTNPGAAFDREVPNELRELGLDPSVCCYEIGLRREAAHCREDGGGVQVTATGPRP